MYGLFFGGDFFFGRAVYIKYIQADRKEVLHEVSNSFPSHCSLRVQWSHCVDDVLISDKACPHDSSEGLTNLVSV